MVASQIRRKRIFSRSDTLRKIPEEGRVIQKFSGKSIVVVTQATPIEMHFSMKQPEDHNNILRAAL